MSRSTLGQSSPPFPTTSWPSRALASAVLGCALFISGAAGLVNQVVWHRSLMVFLGGSESTSSMIVVLVFMAGLGVGSIWMGRQAAFTQDALSAVGWIELILGAVNLGVCVLLRSQLSDSVFAFQRLAASLWIPLHVVYAASAVAILVVPCFLMGATMPLAAEACQRSLGLTSPRVLGLLFFLNTLGGMAGAVIASGFLIARIGQSASLVLAAMSNLLGGVILLTLRFAHGTAPISVLLERTTERRGPFSERIFRPSWNEILAFGLGFCSLSYEMYLFRLIPLRHQPRPFTFAAVLTGFLLFWSLGAALSSRNPVLTPSAALRICAMCCGMTIPLFVLDSLVVIKDALTIMTFVLFRFGYFVPCLFFGYLFATVTARVAKSWGADVGRLYAWNTCGSCLGVLGMTLIAYEIPFYLMVLVIALLLYSLHEYEDCHVRSIGSTQARIIPRWVYPLAGGAITVVIGLTIDLSGAIPSMRLFFGRDGVIGIDKSGNLVWDGLWHSTLSHDNNHVGTTNWYLAVCPVMCHRTGKIDDVCVIGVATGITASTLSKLKTVQQVDAYDINRRLHTIFDRYPEGTLHIADNEKIHLIWQDARSGLSLNRKQYDLIQAQPLYLKQSGSALLNSVEFYRLVSQRLKPRGVFCVYSNGTAEQAFVIRQTASLAFPHGESFFGGYLLVLSNDPIEFTEESLAEKLAQDDPLWEEIRNSKECRDVHSLMRMRDLPRLSWGDGRLVVTDDHPIVEYPAYLSTRIKELGYDLHLSAPGIVPGE